MNTFKNLIAIFGLISVLVLTASAQTSLTGLDGTAVDLSRDKGKVVILALGASWLPLSDDQAEFTNALAKKYSGKNVAVYFIATDSMQQKSKNYATNDKIREFAGKNKLTVTVLRDPDGAVMLSRYAVDQLPTFVILDQNGQPVGKPIGGIDPKFDITVPISARVDKLL